MKDDLISELETAMQRKILNLPDRLRPFTRETGDLPHAVSLTGPRGVGKTTFLLYHSQNRNLLYISADNPQLGNESLYEAIKSVFMTGYSGVIVDEVHFAKDWSRNLKAIYDDFPNHLVWISDSSSLILRSGVGDLSRRFLKIEMPLLSFREFLYLETEKEYAVYDPFSDSLDLPFNPGPEELGAFRKYLEIGTRPFYSEDNFKERLLSVLDKTMYFDVPFFIPNITNGNLRLMKAITATLAESPIPRLQVRSLCADWNIGAEKLYQILEVMASVGILRIIRLENDKKAKTAGHKLFFSDPALYSALNGNTGTAREALVAALLTNAGWAVEAAKDELTGDFVIRQNLSGVQRKFKLEVGGASKKIKRADYVVKDNIDLPSRKTIPLWLLGMTY